MRVTGSCLLSAVLTVGKLPNVLAHRQQPRTKSGRCFGRKRHLAVSIQTAPGKTSQLFWVLLMLLWTLAIMLRDLTPTRVPQELMHSMQHQHDRQLTAAPFSSCQCRGAFPAACTILLWLLCTVATMPEDLMPSRVFRAAPQHAPSKPPSAPSRILLSCCCRGDFQAEAWTVLPWLQCCKHSPPTYSISSTPISM